MTRLSMSATVIVVAIGVLLFPVLMTSQGRRVGTLEVEDVDNRHRRQPAKCSSSCEPACRLCKPRKIVTGVDAESVEAVGRSGHLPGSVALVSRICADRSAGKATRCRLCRAELHRHHICRAERPAVSALVGTEEHRPDRQRRLARDAGRRHRATEALGHRARDTRRTSSPSSIPASTTTIPISRPTSGRRLRRSRSSSAASDHLRGRHARVQRHQPDLRSDGRPQSRHARVRARSARSATTASASPASTGRRRSWGSSFSSAGSGSIADAVDAIDFAIQVKADLCWHGRRQHSRAVEQLGRRRLLAGAARSDQGGQRRDMLFVAAAGNNGISNDFMPIYPASYAAPNVVAVAATTNTDHARVVLELRRQTPCTLARPASTSSRRSRNGGYAFFSGTSMATPHVSGAAALVLSHCALNTADLKDTLVSVGRILLRRWRR